MRYATVKDKLDQHDVEYTHRHLKLVKAFDLFKKIIDGDTKDHIIAFLKDDMFDMMKDIDNDLSNHVVRDYYMKDQYTKLGKMKELYHLYMSILDAEYIFWYEAIEDILKIDDRDARTIWVQYNDKGAIDWKEHRRRLRNEECVKAYNMHSKFMEVR